MHRTRALHSLRYRVPLAVFAVFIVVLGVFMFGLYRIMVHSYAEIEKQDLIADVGRARVALMSAALPLESTVADWAVWTDTYAFMAGENPGFQQNLVEESLDNLSLDFMALYSLSDEVVWVATLDKKGGAQYVEDTPELRSLFKGVVGQLRPDKEDVVKSGIVLLGGRPALFATSSITDNGRQSVPNGHLVLGTYLTTADAYRVKSITGLDVRVGPATGMVQMVTNRLEDEKVVVDDRDELVIVGTQAIDAVNGDPALLLTVNRQRNSLQRAYRTLELVGWALFAAVITFAVALGVTLEKTILKRLSHLHGFVQLENPTQSAHSCVGGTDEIADLAVGLDHALQRAVKTEELLKHQADHDYLTGLPNRRRLTKDVARSIGEARRTDAQVSLLVMDLDLFKEINDAYGHAGGDEALRCFAQRARSAVRDYSTVARIGGDEFSILLPNTDRIGAEQVADRLKELLGRDPCNCAGHTFHLSTSVGIAVFPHDGDSPEELLSVADAGMYEDKRVRRRSAG